MLLKICGSHAWLNISVLKILVLFSKKTKHNIFKIFYLVNFLLCIFSHKNLMSNLRCHLNQGLMTFYYNFIYSMSFQINTLKMTTRKNLMK